MGSPQDNDHFNAKFATKYASVVIALNYNKAPKNPFPGPIHVSRKSLFFLFFFSFFSVPFLFEEHFFC